MRETQKRGPVIVFGLLAVVLLLCVGSGLAGYTAWRNMQPPPTSSRGLEEPRERVQAYLEHRPSPPSEIRDVHFTFHIPETYHGSDMGPRMAYAAIHVDPDDALAWGADCEDLPDDERAQFDQGDALTLLPEGERAVTSVPGVRRCGRYEYYVIYEAEGLVLHLDASEYTDPVNDGGTPTHPLPRMP